MIPKALRVVALIHLFGGLTSLAGIVVQFNQGTISLDFGVLGIPIYFGLMRLSNAWRTCTLVFVGLGIFLTPVVVVFGLAVRVPATLQIFGIPLGIISPVWVSVVIVPWFVLALWQYHILTRDDIKSLFVQPAACNVFDLV